MNVEPLYKPPATYVLRAIILFVIAAPSIALGWTWFPESHSNVWVAWAVSFCPFIPAWYFAKRVQEWYVGAVNYKGVTLFHVVASSTVPGFVEALEAAGKKVTVEYVQQFVSDENFRAVQVLAHIKKRIEEENNDAGENGATD